MDVYRCLIMQVNVCSTLRPLLIECALRHVELNCPMFLIVIVSRYTHKHVCIYLLTCVLNMNSYCGVTQRDNIRRETVLIHIQPCNEVSIVPHYIVIQEWNSETSFIDIGEAWKLSKYRSPLSLVL